MNNFNDKFKQLKIRYKKDMKKYLVLLISIFLMFSFVVGISYSYLTYISKTDNVTLIEAGNLSLELYENSNSISLYDAVPQVDSEAIENNDEYEFVLKNNGTLNSTFKIKLDNTCAIDKEYVLEGNKVKPDKCVPNEYIKVALKEGESKYEVLEYDEEKDEYIIDADKLEVNEERNYKIKIWLDLDTPNEYSSVNDETILYSGKLSIDYEQGEEEYLENYYIIRYNSNGGNGTVSDEKVSFSSEVVLKDNPFTKEGYIFKGYSLEKAGEAIYQAGDSIKELTNLSGGIVNIYAVWEPITYYVKYNVNGGDGTMENSIHTYDKESILSNNEFSRDGYNFIGWSTSSDLNEVVYENKEKIKNLSSVNNEIVNLYAVWQPYTYKIEYNANGGTGEMNDELLKKGEESNLSENTFTNEGYTFSGWSTVPSGDIEYQDKEEIVDLKDIGDTLTLYAVWEPISYQIKYNANGGTGSMENTNHVYDVEQSLSINSFTRTGYTFKGWSTSQTATTATYIDGDNVKNLTATDKEIVNLYAIWEINKYTIDVVVQNGVVDGSTSQIIEYNKNAIFNLIPTQGTNAVVECTNNQTGIVENNILTVSNVNNDSICTVKFLISTTVLYSDGTLIINESPSNRTNNIALYGEVTKEYEALSATQSYVFSESDLSTANNTLWYNEKSSILSIKIEEKISPINTSYWFLNCKNVVYGDFTNLNTSNTTNMEFMFTNFGAVATTFELIGLDGWDVSNVTNMSQLFYNMGSSTENFVLSGIEKWDVSNVTNMDEIFYNSNAKSKEYNLDLSNWNVSNVTDMSSMFQNAGRYSEVFYLKGLDNWNTSKAKDFSNMFYNAGYTATTFDIGDLSSWDTSNVTSMRYVFSYAGYNATTFNLKGINNWNTSQVTNMKSMFDSSGAKATSWSIGDLSNWDTSIVTDMSNMFKNAGDNALIFQLNGLNNWDVSKVANMKQMFSGAGENSTEWSIGDLSKWDVSKVTNMNRMFYNAGSSTATLKLVGLNNWNTSSVTDMSEMFYQLGYDATTFDIGNLSSWNTIKVTNMSKMFAKAGLVATKFDIGDLSNWNTSQVTNMDSMFASAGRTAEEWYVGKLSNWDVSNVTTMKLMFGDIGRNSLKFELNLSTWNPKQVTDMSSMFYCTGIGATTWTIGDISNWDTSQVTNMSAMFQEAGGSVPTFELDLSSWDVSSVTNMSSMFYGTSASESWSIGDLSNWDTSNVTSMSAMFAGLENITSFNSIGTLNIPAGCNVSNFISYKIGLGGTPMFIGNLKINGSLSNYTYSTANSAGMFYKAATDPNARINLYYTNAEAEAIVDELISLYGPSGTVSQGNIYKVES